MSDYDNRVSFYPDVKATEEEVWKFFVDLYTRKGAVGEWYSNLSKKLSDFKSFQEVKKSFEEWEEEVWQKTFVKPGDILENERAVLVVIEIVNDIIYCVGKFKQWAMEDRENPFGAWSFQKEGIEKVWHKTGKNVDLSILFKDFNFKEEKPKMREEVQRV